MAVTSLSLQLSDYRDLACAEVYGGTSGYAGLDAGEQADINRLILRGERTFWLHPPGVEGVHVWSCLRDPGLMDLWQDVAVNAAVTVTSSVPSGTVAAAPAAGTLVAATGTFASWMVGLPLTVTGGGGPYEITGFVSSTIVRIGTASSAADVGQTWTVGATAITASAATFYDTMVGKTINVTTVGALTIASVLSSTVITVTPVYTFSAKTFSIASGGTFGLPSDFESPESATITFTDQTWTPDVALVNEKIVTALRATNSSQTGYPEFAAIRWTSTTGLDPHTQELVVWPDLDAHYQISLPYMVQPTGMTLTTNPYPRGGPEMADCLLSVILALCEEHKTGKRGDRWSEATEKCRAAARRDRARHHNFIAGMMRPDSGSRRTAFDVKRLVLPA